MALDARTTPDPLAARRTHADALWRALASEPWRLGFFMALRRLECARPDLPRWGESERVSEEALRFAQSERTLFDFNASALHRYEPATRTSPPRLYVNCFGLLGPNGPMPPVITDLVRTRARRLTDLAALRFFDLINHRMLSIHHRAWSQSMQTVSYDRADPTDERAKARALDREDDRFAFYLASIAGLTRTSLRGRHALPPKSPLFHAGWLAHRTRPAEGLAAIASSFFGVESSVTEFVVRQAELPREQRSFLSRPSPDGTPTGWTIGNPDGRGAILGSNVWGCQSSFRLTLGPMTLADYDRLLPCNRGARRLGEWMLLYVGEEFDWEVQLILQAKQVPPAVLGTTIPPNAKTAKAGERVRTTPEKAYPVRLGWSAWLPYPEKLASTNPDRAMRDRGEVRLHARSFASRPRT